MSDEDDSGTLVRGPWGGDSSYVPPPIPDYADTIPPPEDIPAAPPESPEETTLQLPVIPAAPDPATALRSDGIPAPEVGDVDSENEDGEYSQRRSLADRLGDWLEYRIEMARARHESEAPFREAEIARKAALLEGRTAQDVALMEANGKLHQAMMKAKGDKAAARGKADTDRVKSSGSGLGADKGRSKMGSGGGTSRGGGGSGGARGNSGPGSNRPGSARGGSNSGGPGGRPGAGSAGKGSAKGPDRSPDGRTVAPRRERTSGGLKTPQTGSGGSGRGGSGGPGKTLDPHKPGSRPWRGRTGTSKPSAGVGPWKDKLENKPAPKSSSTAGKPDPKNTPGAKAGSWRTNQSGRGLAGAVIDPHKPGERPWKTRPKTGKINGAATSPKVGGPAPGAGPKPGGKAKDAPGKVDLSKGATGKAKSAPKNASDGAAGGRRDAPASDESGKASGVGGGPYSGFGAGWSKGSRFRSRRAGRPGHGGRSANSPFGPEDSTPTVEWPDHPTRPPRPGGGDDYPDAVIVDDDHPRSGRWSMSSPPPATAGAKSLPAAPEPHTQRPGTTRPPSKENQVSNTEVTTASGQGGLAAQHRTDITFDEYLMEIANIAVTAGLDKDRAEELAMALAKVADALRDMAADLVGDHNVSTAVTDLISDLADSASRMKQQAQRCAADCDIAYEAAKLAGGLVAKVYGEDMNAVTDAGLKYASSANHHD
ncbi:ATP/GTP-binding protein [Streptomyces sp. NPDC004589]|uniref:ATP/GTP-binding protein n=1 Tax=Streptomyces sp. NPDC004589 TaxID=3154553 RepID=UPI0033A920A6